MERKADLISRAGEHDFVPQDPNFDRKLDLITAGGRPHVKEHLLTRITRENCQVIINYILDFMTEVNPAQGYRLNTIGKLKQLAQYYHPRPFKDLTRQDLVNFLDSFTKPESVDSLHKWKGTRENTRIILLRFFKWLILMMLTLFFLQHSYPSNNILSSNISCKSQPICFCWVWLFKLLI